MVTGNVCREGWRVGRAAGLMHAGSVRARLPVSTGCFGQGGGGIGWLVKVSSAKIALQGK